jgi:glutathione S-transferase
MKLYEFGPTRSIRVRWMLQELGVDFEATTVNLLAGEHRQQPFLKINPAGKLPAVIDGDTVLTESVAIVLYLAEKYPEKNLMPTALEQRGQALRWLMFAATELEQPLWRMALHTTVYPEEKRVPAAVPCARDDFLKMARVIDRHMEGRKFVLGDRVSAVDFVLAYTLDWAGLARLLGDFPRLEAYVDDMYARPQAPLRIKQAFAQIRGAASA